jgi:dTDP-4-amino-4,6-dideoxygalactose transaminase
VINDPDLTLRAEILRDTGRGRYFRGEVAKYTWQDVGSSFLPVKSPQRFCGRNLKRRKILQPNEWQFSVAITKC